METKIEFSANVTDPAATALAMIDVVQKVVHHFEERFERQASELKAIALVLGHYVMLQDNIERLGESGPRSLMLGKTVETLAKRLADGADGATLEFLEALRRVLGGKEPEQPRPRHLKVVRDE